ncbi:putative nucleotide-binding protein [Dysgonomonas hofstadii]|uniref:Putative nucleotide-binding protein n=1 Tax=Dysgonomonas hofstadii TaxID=637886 RepID=A0A840CEM4_9BACT|nr:hypothetical protein [Dysgonomonas hofstadii]MBB4034437.1 putative nucleotide-binding protein [Dysgonomonas hofstadii]
MSKYDYMPMKKKNNIYKASGLVGVDLCAYPDNINNIVGEHIGSPLQANKLKIVSGFLKKLQKCNFCNFFVN